MKKKSKHIIKLFEPYAKKEELQSVESVLKSKFWASGSGVNKVKAFENAFAKYVGSKSVVAVNSGTAALHLAVSAFNVTNTEILVPSMSFVSTAHAAVYNKAKPLFVDVDERTLCIDMDDLEKKFTKKTSAVLPVHFGGYPCDIKKLHSITKNLGIHVIEDAAHACGAFFDNKKIGSHSDLVCFSFHPVKNLSMPTGGAIAINADSNIESTLKSLRWCGITNRNESYYDVDKLGYNYYMNEISATIGLVQLKRLDKMNQKRRKIAKQYFKSINVEYKMPFSSDCSYHLYWVRVKNRDEFMKKMREEGIETGIHYKPIHTMTFYKTSQKLQTSERIWKELVSIPIHLNLSQNDIDKIISCVNKYSISTN